MFADRGRYSALPTVECKARNGEVKRTSGRLAVNPIHPRGGSVIHSIELVVRRLAKGYLKRVRIPERSGPL